MTIRHSGSGGERKGAWRLAARLSMGCGEPLSGRTRGGSRASGQGVRRAARLPQRPRG